MPGRRSSKYKPEQTALWEGEVMIILAEAQEALTIDEIKQRSINLTGVTPQKMARILGHLIDMGNVVKAQSKERGRMVYKSLAVMREQGYDVQRQRRQSMFFKVYAGLGGGFGGANYQGTFEYESEEEASADARRMAVEEYESYEGNHGLQSFDDVARGLLQDEGYEEDEIDDMTSEDVLAFCREAGISEDDIQMNYDEEVDGWIHYYVKPATSLDDKEED